MTPWERNNNRSWFSRLGLVPSRVANHATKRSSFYCSSSPSKSPLTAFSISSSPYPLLLFFPFPLISCFYFNNVTVTLTKAWLDLILSFLFLVPCFPSTFLSRLHIKLTLLVQFPFSISYSWAHYYSPFNILVFSLFSFLSFSDPFFSFTPLPYQVLTHLLLLSSFFNHYI